MADPKVVHVRLPAALVKRIDHLGVEWQTDRAQTIGRLLAAALERGGERKTAATMTPEQWAMRAHGHPDLAPDEET